MKKLLLTLPLVAGISWAGSTYYSGEQAEASYNRMLEQINALSKDVFVLKSTEYQAGIMESTAITEFTTLPAAGREFTVSLKHQINHSLISVDSKNSRFGSASIITTLLLDDNITDEGKAFLTSFESGQPFVITTEVAVDGATTNEIIVNSVEHTKDNSTFKTSGALINLDTSASGSVTADMSTDNLVFSDSSDEQVNLSDINLTFDMKKLAGEADAPNFYDLNMETTLGEFTVIQGDESDVNFSDMSTKLDLQNVGYGENVSPLYYLFHVKELNLLAIDFDQLDYEANLAEMKIVDSEDESGTLTNMSTIFNVGKSDTAEDSSAIYYDVNIETKVDDFNVDSPTGDAVSMSNLLFKVNMGNFGNGETLVAFFHALDTDEVEIENINLDDVTFEAKMDEMDVAQEGDNGVKTSDVAMQFEMNKLGTEDNASSLFFDLNLGAKMGKIDVIKNGVQLALIEGARYVLAQDLSSGEPSAKFSVGVDSLEVPALPLKSFIADLALTGFSMQELIANESFFEELKTASKPEKFLLSEKAAGIMRATFKPDTKLAIKLDATSSEGNGNADADVWFAGNGSDDGYTGMVTVGDLAKSFAGTAVGDIDKPALMLTPLGSMLEHPMAQAYLTITDDKVTLNATLDKLILKLNEQIIPLDLMAGEALNRPLDALVP